MFELTGSALFFSYLDELSIAGECAAEYLALYQKLIKPAHWKVYLAARGVLPYIGNLITKVTAVSILIIIWLLQNAKRRFIELHGPSRRSDHVIILDNDHKYSFSFGV